MLLLWQLWTCLCPSHLAFRLRGNHPKYPALFTKKQFLKLNEAWITVRMLEAVNVAGAAS